MPSIFDENDYEIHKPTESVDARTWRERRLGRERRIVITVLLLLLCIGLIVFSLAYL